MELVTINDELIIKVNCITIVHKNSDEYSDIFKLSVIHLFSDNETYLCHVPLNYLYKFNSQFKVDKNFADIIQLDKKFINEYVCIIHANNIFNVIKGIIGSKCISCKTFIDGVEDNRYTCYSCKQNPFPSWRQHD